MTIIYKTPFAKLLFIALLINMPAKADFERGMQYYQEKVYEKAFHEFMQAAQYGDYSAQYNLGVMYFRGEFVEKDNIQSYAWFALAAQSEQFRKIAHHKKIFAQLGELAKEEAGKVYQKLLQTYGDEAVYQRIMPTFVGAQLLTKRLRVVKKVLPDYPRRAQRRGESGWVDVFYTVAKDGTTRDHVVFYSTSKRFTEEAIEALRAWRYEPTTIDGNPVAVNGVKMRFLFHIEGFEADDTKVERHAAELLKKATKGDASAKLQYAYFLDAAPSFLPEEYDFMDNPNKWYLEAARRGSAAASFFLGRNILYGNMCTVDTSKSFAWLVKAASNNLNDAQYTLAVELMSGARFEKDMNKAMYWLERAAQNNANAQLRYAWILATHVDEAKRDGKKAMHYFNKVDEDHHDRQTYYEVAAAVAAENGDFEAAVDWQKEALEDAQELKLPEKAIKARLTAYRQN